MRLTTTKAVCYVSKNTVRGTKTSLLPAAERDNGVLLVRTSNQEDVFLCPERVVGNRLNCRWL